MVMRHLHWLSPKTLARLARLYHQEFTVVVILLLMVGSIWLFVEIADEIQDRETLDFDSRVMWAFRLTDNPQQLVGPEWVEDEAVAITNLASNINLTLLTLGAAGFLCIKGKHHAMILLLVATVGGALLNWGLKDIFARPRPEIVPPLVYEVSHSFPSGHSMIAATVYLTLAVIVARMVSPLKLRVYLLLLATLVMVLVGLSRVILGVHYPTDVLGGWTAGAAWAALCWLVAWFLQRRGTVEHADLGDDGTVEEPVRQTEANDPT